MYLFFCNLVSLLIQTWICCTRWSGIHQMTVWEQEWTTPLKYSSRLSRSPLPPTSRSMNFHVTVATTSWWTQPPWPAAITFAVTVWPCGGSPLTKMSARSAGRSGKAFLKSTYCWGMLFTARPYQETNVWFSDHRIHISLMYSREQRPTVNLNRHKVCVSARGYHLKICGTSCYITSDCLSMPSNKAVFHWDSDILIMFTCTLVFQFWVLSHSEYEVYTKHRETWLFSSMCTGW